MDGSVTPERAGSLAAMALAGLSLAWAVLVPVAPWLSAREGGGATLAAIVRGAGSVVCHQRADRSFAPAGRPWPVCARCSGIYLAGGATVLWCAAARGARRRLCGASRSEWRAAAALAIAPIGATWLLERAGLAGISNLARAVSGAPVGCLVAAAVMSNVRGTRPSTVAAGAAENTAGARRNTAIHDPTSNR